MKKKRSRSFRARKLSPIPAFREWQVVLAELQAGKVSVGVRFDQLDTVHFFLMHKTPEGATRVVADIAQGKMTLRDIANYDWRAVDLPYEKPEEKEEDRGE